MFLFCIAFCIPNYFLLFVAVFGIIKSSTVSSDTSRQAALLHQEMIALFERELVLEIILVVGQEMELRENAQYNLLMMEILHHIVKAQDPSAVAKCMIKSSSSASDTSTTAGATKNNPVASNRFSTSSSILASKLKQEQAQRRNMSTVRHGHFGGTWMRQQADGKRQFVGASAIVQNSVGSQLQRQVQARRRNRMAEPFIGSSKTLLAHTRLPMADCGPATKRANATLNKFCQRFMADCYGPFMKSLKNEFRRDSVRLEEGDKVVFFKLIWFFAQWWRVSSQSQGRAQNSNDNKEAIGRLIITMDVFTFNLVLNATDSFFQHKKHTRLAHAVALYCEMMHLLYEMYTSKDNTEHEMAIGLIDRLFYGQEALDRLPKLLSRWTPGTYTREYLCNLVEVAHMSVKLLEANHKMGAEHMKSIKSASTDKSISNKISKMMSVAAEFDIKTYLLRKVVSNQMITMYVHLLAQYKTNATLVNHRIIAMFLRLMRLEIALPEVADADIPLNPLGTKRVTIEPMLYNLQLIMVLEQVLNDLSIRREKSFEPLLQFSTNLMYNFWSAADANPMLYVECLFRHPVPHRFCESVTNMYVSDELRMLAEREILREDQFLLEADEGDAEIPGEDDDDDEELEFTGDNVQAGTDSSGEPLSSDDSPNVDDEEKRESEIKDSNREEPSAGYDAMDDRIDTERKRARNDDSEKLNKEPASKIPRTGRAVEDDDSDDDFEFGTSNEEIPFAGKQNQAKTKQKYAIEDEDSDDE
jgi:timeless